VWATALFIIPSDNQTLSGLFFGLTGSIVTGLIFYGSFSLFFKSKELEKVVDIARKGIR